jgi:uncharacterized protein
MIHMEAAVGPSLPAGHKKITGPVRQTEGQIMIWDTLNNEVQLPLSASADEFLAIGMKYCLGRGVEQSYVTAHKWFNIAAMKGSDTAKNYRCEIAAEMSASDIAEAQRQARAFITLH